MAEIKEMAEKIRQAERGETCVCHDLYIAIDQRRE